MPTKSSSTPKPRKRAATRPGKGGTGKLKVGGTKSRSPYGRAERRERAYKAFAKGKTNMDVARDLRVHPDTVSRYRAQWKEQLKTEADANPDLLTDVLSNTVQMLQELDLVRKEAWTSHDRGHTIEVECDECSNVTKALAPQKAETRAQMLRILLTANEQKAKLLQLFGVKAEFMAHVNQVAQLQTRLIAFMRDRLCEEDKAALEQFLSTVTGQVAANSTMAELDVVDAEVLS